MSNPSLTSAAALRRFSALLDGVPEAIAELERIGSLQQAADEADARLAARTRDIEIEDARLQSRIQAAAEREAAADVSVKDAEDRASAIIADAENRAEAAIANEAERVETIERDAAARAARSMADAVAAEQRADDANAAAVEAEARQARAEQQLAALRAKLEG